MTILAKHFDSTKANNADLLAMLALLANPTSFQTRMDELQAKEKTCNEKIALAGQASEIVHLREQAEQSLKRARETEELARTQSITTEQTARLQADDILVTAQLQAQSVIDAAEKRAVFIQEDIMAIKSLTQLELDKHRQDLEAREAQLRVKEEEMKAWQMSRDSYLEAQKKYEERLTFLKETENILAARLANG